jgi:predicted metal-dependent hydrolase
MAVTTPQDVAVTPRDLHFSMEGASERAWLGGDPVGTAVFNALSLTFPDGERLFMDAVRNYRPQLSGKLLADANAFITQEAIHSREHVGLNAALDRSRYPVAEIEDELKRRMVLARGRGPIAMLSVTIALEHFTAMMADLFLEEPEFWDGVPEDLARLWQWHAMEETEHKAVAFDVFQEISKNWKPSQRYGLRVRIMLIMTVMFVSNITTFSSMLLIADGMKPWKARLSVLGYLFGKPGLFRKSWKAYWDWFRPGFHPWHHDNSATLKAWQDRFAVAVPQAVAAE